MIVAGVLAVTLAGFTLGAVVMAAGSRTVSTATARARWYKLAVFFVIVHVMLGAAALRRPWVIGVLIAILAAGTVELARAWQRVAEPRPSVIWPVFLTVAVAALWNASRIPPAAFGFLFLCAAAGDGFAQVVGQWLGRRPLAPSVSPAKTIEGFLAGLCAAASVAVLASGLVEWPPLRAAALGLLIGVTGLAGDLAASWVKRRAQLKDYSGALPGQGGFLDRFDSLLGTLALVGWML